MLVLARCAGEEIVIGDDIRITVLSISKTVIRVGIAAPANVRVDRQEVRNRRTDVAPTATETAPG